MPIVQVLPDGSEIGRVFRTALGIVSDLNMFAIAAAGLEPVKPGWAKWTQELRSLREAQRAVPNYQGPLNLGTVMRELETMLTRDAIVTTDAANFAGWATRFLNFSEGQRYIGPTNGAMGYSVPAEVGAKVAFRTHGRQHGRGWRFHDDRTRIATAFHHGVAPIVLVFNNQMCGDPHASGKSLSPGGSPAQPDQPGFRQIYRGVRRPWRNRQRHPGVCPGVPPSG